jgi:hypothetical protein
VDSLSAESGSRQSGELKEEGMRTDTLHIGRLRPWMISLPSLIGAAMHPSGAAHLIAAKLSIPSH